MRLRTHAILALFSLSVIYSSLAFSAKSKNEYSVDNIIKTVELIQRLQKDHSASKTVAARLRVHETVQSMDYVVRYKEKLESMLKAQDVDGLEKAYQIFLREYAAKTLSEQTLHDLTKIPFSFVEYNNLLSSRDLLLVEKSLSAWEKRYPNSLALALIRSTFYSDLGQHYRTNSSLNKLAKTRYEKAQFYWKKSRAFSHKLIRLNPAISISYVNLQNTGISGSERDKSYQQGIKHNPDSHMLRSYYLRNLSPGWGELRLSLFNSYLREQLANTRQQPRNYDLITKASVRVYAFLGWVIQDYRTAIAKETDIKRAARLNLSMKKLTKARNTSLAIMADSYSGYHYDTILAGYKDTKDAQSLRNYVVKFSNYLTTSIVYVDPKYRSRYPKGVARYKRSVLLTVAALKRAYLQ